jgi:uncharacterized protein (DUF58 family)
MMRAAIMREFWRRIRESFEESMRQQITAFGFVFTLLVALIGLGAFISGNNLLFLLLAALLSTLLISGFVSRMGLAGLELDVELPPHVVAKRDVPAKIHIRNRKVLMPSFSLHLAGAPETGLREELYVPVVPSGGQVTEAAALYFSRRGEYKRNTFWFSSRFPFGLTYRRAHLRLEKEVIVYPSIDPQPGFELLLSGIAGELQSNQQGRGTDFYRVRPYVAFESSRHVDWKATAHTGELQVREYARDQDQTVTVFLDLSTTDAQWFEVAVDCSAYLVWQLSERGVRVRFLTQRWSPENAHVYDILRYLAVVEPNLGLKPALPHERTLQIAFSTRPAELADVGWSHHRVITPDAFGDRSAIGSEGS